MVFIFFLSTYGCNNGIGFFYYYMRGGGEREKERWGFHFFFCML